MKVLRLSLLQILPLALFVLCFGYFAEVGRTLMMMADRVNLPLIARLVASYDQWVLVVLLGSPVLLHVVPLVTLVRRFRRKTVEEGAVSAEQLLCTCAVLETVLAVTLGFMASAAIAFTSMC